MVLDPGHGGSNTGAAGVVEGLYEKTNPRDCQQAYQSLLHKTADRLAIVFDWNG